MTSHHTTSSDIEPIHQGERYFRARWPEWIRQLPRLRFPPPDENFQLIDREELAQMLANVSPDVAERIRADIEYMDHELLRLFRERDYQASLHQNRYRRYQVMYIVLAALASMIGAGMALSLNAYPQFIPLLAIAEVCIAAFTTYMATVGSRPPPLATWLDNRRRAEYLRREYFRYLANLPPYAEQTGYRREMLLATRAARINQGSDPGVL